MSKVFRRFAKDEDGATAIEYGLIVALIFLVALSAITSFGTSMNTMYGVISSTIGGATH
ncbi:MAG TPA: Flp family type IVb pilin [Caulobacteraceae bacterium]|nr:Flp family type IVb pilin [Caulobacteraceae bacterium]